MINDYSSDDEGFAGWSRAEIDDDLTIIPYECSIPSPDFKLWIYESICNIAFAKSRRGFIYKCLILGCQFQTLVKETLLCHLQKKHESSKWNGFCNVCADIIETKERSGVVNEYEHMNETHIKDLEIERQMESLAPSTFGVRKSLESVEPSPKLDSVITKLKQRPELSVKPIVQQQILPTSTVQKQRIEKLQLKSPKLLRPWLKSGNVNTKPIESVNEMLSMEALCSTHKCMSPTCCYFSSDSNLFRKHIVLHEKFTPADKFYLMCFSCEFVAKSVENLMTHLEQHAEARYQCNFCFYRSTTNFNVMTHQNQFHKGESKITIELPGLSDGEPATDRNKARRAREANLPPLICVFCHGIFFVMKTFLDHILTHDEKTVAKCIKCDKTTTKTTLENHLKCHGLGLLHCVYCRFGTDETEALTNHISNDHPMEVPLFCERTAARKPNGTLLTVSIFII